MWERVDASGASSKMNYSGTDAERERAALACQSVEQHHATLHKDAERHRAARDVECKEQREMRKLRDRAQHGETRSAESGKQREWGN